MGVDHRVGAENQAARVGVGHAARFGQRQSLGKLGRATTFLRVGVFVNVRNDNLEAVARLHENVFAAWRSRSEYELYRLWIVHVTGNLCIRISLCQRPATPVKANKVAG